MREINHFSDFTISRRSGFAPSAFVAMGTAGVGHVDGMYAKYGPSAPPCAPTAMHLHHMDMPARAIARHLGVPSSGSGNTSGTARLTAHSKLRAGQ